MRHLVWRASRQHGNSKNARTFYEKISRYYQKVYLKPNKIDINHNQLIAKIVILLARSTHYDFQFGMPNAKIVFQL